MEAGLHPVYCSCLLQKEVSFREIIAGVIEWRSALWQKAVLDE